MARGDECVLLPTDRRPNLFAASAGKGAKSSKEAKFGKKGKPGRSNTFYITDEKGAPRDLTHPPYSWIQKVLRFVENYEGENLVSDPIAEAKIAAIQTLEDCETQAGGQGFRVTPEMRKAIEMHAMNAATKYFKKRGYQVDAYVYKNHPFDLLCRSLDGKNDELRVEVKGTQGMGQSVFLTKNEVASAKKNASALFVLHSIQVTGQGKQVKASGGTVVVLQPWQIKAAALTAEVYRYSLPKQGEGSD